MYAVKEEHEREHGKEDNIFFGGVPTGPDVKRIIEAWPPADMAPGVVIHFSSIGDLIGINSESSRFRTVTERWRREMEKDHGILLGCPGDKTFVVLDDYGKVDLIKKKVTSAFKSSRRALRVSTHVDRRNLDDEGRLVLDHQRRCAGQIAAMKQTRKKSLPPV